jgi:acyl-CoA dehydrogenase
MLTPSPLRDRLTADIDLGARGVALLERAFTLTVEAEPLRQKLRRDGIRDWREAEKSGALSEAEVAQLTALDEAVAKVIAVDDFEAGAFARTGAEPQTQASAAAKPRKQATGSRTKAKTS